MCILCEILEADASDKKKYIDLLQLNIAVDNEVLSNKKLLSTKIGREKLMNLSAMKVKVVEIANMLKIAIDLADKIPGMPKFNPGDSIH